jgi:capsular exopolysaccharide synthesis family protein
VRSRTRDTLARGIALRDAGALLRRRWWIVALCVVLIPGAVYFYSAKQAKTYEASVIIQPEDTGATAAVGSQLTSENGVGILAGYATLGEVAAATDSQLRQASGLTDLTSSVDSDTGWLKLTTTAASPRHAMGAANAYATALIRYVKVDVGRRTDAAIVATRQSVAAVHDSTQRSEISDALSRLTALRDATAQPVTVVSTGNASVASPHPSRNALLAVILALLLAPPLVLFVDRFDRTLRRPTDLERLSGARLLASVPKAAFAHPRDPGSESAFQRLRDMLIYFDARSRPKAVAIMSALEGEGRTTVATGLADSFARAGKRVVLVDADLRSPGVAARVGAPAAPGLSDVIAGHDLPGALHAVDVFEGRLTVLPAGSPLPGAGELLGSDEVSALLARLTRDYDFVVIDTPPLLVASGALGLAAKASGCVAVARLDRTPRDAVRRMMRTVASAGGRVVGVVATGAPIRADFATPATTASPAEDEAGHATPVARVV